MIRFQWNEEEGRAEIAVTGKLDTTTTPVVDKEIRQCLEKVNVRELRLDLSEVEYVTSAGLRMFLSLKMKYRQLVLANVQPVVYRVLHMTGLDGPLGVDQPEGYVYEEDEEPSPARDTRETGGAREEDSPETELTGINDTADPFEFRSVIDLFRDQVRKHPDKKAVVTPTGSITYGLLEKMSNRVANFLAFMGVGKEDVILIMLPRGIEAYAAALGVLKAGAAYTMLHVDYPDDRVDYIFKDAGCRYLLSNRKTVVERLEYVADVLQRRPLYMEEMISIGGAFDPEIRIGAEDLCYLIYTSGSTGKPKGVMIEHRNLSNFVWPAAKNYEANGITQKGTVLLAMAQMTFDVSVMEMYLGLTSGMTVALATENEILNPLMMRDFMLKNQVDAVCFTPAYANTLVSIPEMRPALRNIVTYDFGAEAFPGSLFLKLRDVNPDAYIMNGYGPTEATISCTMKEITSPDNITIGKPNANVYVFIVNENLEEVPRGETGELLVCGLGVGRGYRNLPEKTKEAFIRFKGMRAYRTGDLARINENDEIEFHGRRDNQVKLRGLRIELDEVEKAIAAHPAVKLAAAKVFDNRILVGYYEPGIPGSVTVEEIRETAGKTLAHYMMPEVFVEIDKMPMTPNRKIDRKALPRPEIREEEVVPPENERQEKILAALREVFEDIPVGITTNIISLGISSLDSMVLSAALSDAFDVDVRFSDIHDNPTVIEMEKMILGKEKRTKHELKDRYSCAGNDSMLLVYGAWQADQDNTQWNLPYLYTVRDPGVSAEKLRDAVAKAISAHPGIHARFEEQEGTVYLCPVPAGPETDIPVKDMTEEEFGEYRTGMVRPFRSGEPLWRAEIIRTEAALYLYLDFAHPVMDAESFSIVLADIDRAYRGEEVLPESFTIFDQLEEMEEFCEKGGLKKVWDYYDNLFTQAGKPGRFHRDRQDSALRVKRYTRRLSVTQEEITRTIRPLRISETILFMGLAAAYVAGDDGSREIYFPVTYNGRADSRLNRTVGLTAQAVFELASWDENTTAGDYLRNLQTQTVTVFSFPTNPYGELIAKFPALTTFSYSYLGDITGVYPLGEAKMEEQALSQEGTGGLYGLYLEMFMRDGAFHGSCEYRANELDEASVSRIFDGMETMIRNFRPEMKLDELLRLGRGNNG